MLRNGALRPHPKEDNKTMAEEKKEPWLNYLALTTVILAVCATLSTFKGGAFSTRSVMSQTQASDQWSYYQAKSIKGYLYEMQKDRLEIELKLLGTGGSRSTREEYRQKLEEYGKKIAKYDGEKGDIQKEAKRFEKVRDDAQKHAQAFGIAVIFLQIAILLSSVAALLKKKILWLLSLAVGIAGIVYFANGFMLFV
jgi:cation transport ATPase